MVKRLTNFLVAMILTVPLVGGMQLVGAAPYPVVAGSTDVHGSFSNGSLPSDSQLSADGTQLAFLSDATNLDPNFSLPPRQPNAAGIAYVYLKNLQTGTARLISTGTHNEVNTVTQGNNGVLRYFLTPDAHHLGFTVPYDLYNSATPPEWTIYVRDLDTGITTQANVDNNDQTVGGQLFSISDDGRYVAFTSGANGQLDQTYIRDIRSNTTSQLPINGMVELISGNGQYVFYNHNNSGVTYRYSLTDGSNVPIEASNAAHQAPHYDSISSVSYDGDTVVYSTASVVFPSDMSPCNSDGNSISRTYIHNIGSGTTTLADINSDGSGPSPNPSSGQCGASTGAQLSSDGTKVVFLSSQNLAGNTEGGQSDVWQVYVRDLSHSTTSGISLGTTGRYINGFINNGGANPWLASISADGSKVSFVANSNDLPGDGTSQVYVTPGVVLPVVGTPSLSANPVGPGQSTTLTVPASEVSGAGVTGGEYYLGPDPGPGNGTHMPFDGSDLSATFGSELSPGTYSISVRAVDAHDVWGDTSSTQLTVNPPNSPPAITSNASATSGMRAPFDFHITTGGFPLPSLTETGSLPSGITFTDARNGTASLSGIAAAGTNGVYPITVTATNTQGTASQNFILTIDSSASTPNFISSNSDTEAFGAPFSYTIYASGYPLPTVTKKGALPSGVTWTNNSDGTATIAGTPSNGAQGNYPLTFTAKNGSGSTTQNFTLSITKAPIIKAVNSPMAVVGTPYTLTIGTKGYTTPALTESGDLPAGLNFIDNSNGTATISGTPETGSGGAHSITITATNQSGTAIKTFTLKVGEAPTDFPTGNNAGFPPGLKSSFQVRANGYPAPTTYSITGTLPAGMQFNGTTGKFSGKPTVDELGSYPLVLTATNSYGSYSMDFTLNVAYPT